MIEEPVMEGYKIKRTGIRYFGSKIRALPLLLSYFPEPTRTTIFIDVFCGSGVVTVNYGARNNVMNDKDDLLFSYFKVVSNLDSLNEFKKELKSVVRGQAWFDDLLTREDVIGKALLFYMLNRNNFSGKVDLTEKSPFHVHLPRNIPLAIYDDLVKFFEETDTRVWNYDFRRVLDRAMAHKVTNKYGVFIYLDPPYYDAGRNLYSKDWTIEDQNDLNTYCEDLPHHWIMSNENTDEVREMFGKFYSKEVRWYYSGSSTECTISKSEGKSELLFSNRKFVKRPLGSDLEDMKKLDEWIN